MSELEIELRNKLIDLRDYLRRNKINSVAIHLTDDGDVFCSNYAHNRDTEPSIDLWITSEE